MTNRKTLLPTFQSVPSGLLASTATAFCDLDAGKLYKVIWLEVGDDGTATKIATPTKLRNGVFSSTGAATNGVACSATEFNLNNLIGQIRLLWNGNVFRTMTAFELNRLNAKNNLNGTGIAAFSAKSSGPAQNTGSPVTGYKIYIPIWFSAPWRQNPGDVDKLAFNAVGGKLQIQVDFQPGCSSPNIAGFYEWEPADTQRGVGVIEKWIRQSLGATGTTQDFNSLSTWVNQAKGDFLQAVALFPTDEATPKCVYKVKFTVDGVDVQDLLNINENQAVLLARQMSPDTDGTAPRFDMELDYDDPIDNALPLSQARSINVHVEYGSGNGTVVSSGATAAGTMIALCQRVGLPE